MIDTDLKKSQEYNFDMIIIEIFFLLFIVSHTVMQIAELYRQDMYFNVLSLRWESLQNNYSSN